MLQKFSVENFKGFKEKITLDIGSPNNYNFNSELIEKGCVTKGIIYGINSCGKSNLGLAIFDLITHLTEKEKLLRSYDFYLNMSGRKSFAEFEYTFVFDSHEVIICSRCIRQVHLIGNYEIITLPAGENIRKAGSCR